MTGSGSTPTPSKRELEKRVEDLEDDKDDEEDMTISEAMWEALTDYYDR